MVWHIIIITVFIVIYNIWRYYHEEEDSDYGPVVTETSENNQVVESVMEETINTRQLALKTIENIGSEPKVYDQVSFQFEYQGVIFLIETINDCDFVNLGWPWCYSFSKFDIDEFARVRQVLNDINARGMASAFYGITDSDYVAVHLKKNFLFVQQIPDLEDYLKAMLEIFFRTARILELEVEKLRMQECEKQD